MFKDLKDKIKEYWLWIAVIVIGVIATFGIFYFSNDCAKAGTIGDTLSGVFTSLAFICAIFTVALQRKELSLQRKELEQTREELRGQKEQFEIQNKTLKRQQFENTFFNMLKTQENIVSNLRISKDCFGRITFEELFNELNNDISYRDTLEKMYDKTENKQKLSKKEEIQMLYNNIHSLILLDHYFRHMYRIVKFIKETDFSFCLEEDKNKSNEEKNKKIKEEKYRYTSILRATLSPYELVLLFYNCLNEENKLRPLIEEYSFLQNIRSEFLKKETLAYYKDEAYGNRYEAIKKELGNRA